MSVLQHLSSLRLALAGMVLLGGGALVSYRDPDATVAWLVLPLLLLAVNLIAALLFNPRFRRQHGLLIFHLGLLAVVLLAAYGHMTALKARVELTEGQTFDIDAVTVVRQGPWHPWRRLAAVDFVQGPLQVHYAAGLSRGRTHSRVHFPGAATYPVEIGDNIALKVAGYRFHTTSNKGYSAVLTRADPDTGEHRGAVHFPSYPFHDWKQVNHWTGPGGVSIDLELQLPVPPPETRDWVLESARASGSLKLTAADETVVLKPGEQQPLAGGSVRFEDIRLWMGYEVTYNPVLPWLFSAALVAVLGLGWHFQAKFRAPVPATRSGEETGSGVLSAHV